MLPPAADALRPDDGRPDGGRLDDGRLEASVRALEAALPDGFRLRRLTWDADAAPAWRAWLSDAERARLDGFGPAKRRREFLLGRAALRLLVAEALGLAAPAAAPLHAPDDGAVELVPGAAPEGLRVSLTHGHGEAVAVLAPRPVGLDAERIRGVIPRVVRFVLAPAERAALARRPGLSDGAGVEAGVEAGVDEAGVILAWTLKEATLKGLRVGLYRAPNKLRLTLLDPPPAACPAAARPAAARLDAREGPWHARYVRHGAGWLAVAWTDAA